MSAASTIDSALYDQPSKRIFCPYGCFKRLRVGAGEDEKWIVEHHRITACKATPKETSPRSRTQRRKETA